MYPWQWYQRHYSYVSNIHIDYYEAYTFTFVNHDEQNMGILL